MLLAINCNNTNIKFGVVDGDRNVGEWRQHTSAMRTAGSAIASGDRSRASRRSRAVQPADSGDVSRRPPISQDAPGRSGICPRFDRSLPPIGQANSPARSGKFHHVIETALISYAELES